MTDARRLISVMLVALCAVVGVLGLTGAPAQAASIRSVIGSFGPGGPGSGDFSEVTGVAVEQSSHDVYVYDAGEGGRVYKFNAVGEPQKFSSLPANVIENVGGYGSGESEIAVDSSSGLDKGDIYVATLEEVAIYAPTGARLGTLTTEGGPIGVAVDPSGDVYIAFYEDEAVKKYTPATNPVTEADYTSSLSGVGAVSNIAVDSAGDVYATEFGSDVTRYAASEFNALGMPAFGTVIDPEGATLAVDPSSGGDVYIDERSDIAEYNNPEGSRVESFGTLSESYGVAESHESGDVYASAAADESEVVIYGPPVAPVVYPTVAVGSVSELHDTSVTLNGTVNPDETEVTACEFEYGTTTHYGQSRACSKAVPFSGNSAEPVSASVTALQSGTTYYFRLTATNSNGTEESAGSFTTPGPTVAAWTSDVTSTSADLHAQIDPRGAATSYYFQYGPTTSYGTSVPVAPGVNIGSGTTEQSVVPQHLQGLAPDTTYHYTVATVQDSEVVAGPDHTFATQAAGSESVLPDGREWEIVSPLDKDGAEPKEIVVEGGAIQASEAGGAITYTATGPMPADGEVEGNVSPNFSQILSVRDGVNGWVSQDIMPPTGETSGLSVGLGQDYRLFSSSLALGLVKPFTGNHKLAQPPLSPVLSPGEVQEKTISLRADAPLAPEASEAASYDAAKRNGELMRNAGYLAVLNSQNAPGVLTSGSEFEDATPDLSHIVLEPEEGNGLLYEWGPGGALQPVSVLPRETSGVVGFLGGGTEYQHMVRHAISNSGTLVFWTGENSAREEHLYVRDTDTQETLQIDAFQGGSQGGGGAEEGAEDGEPFFWTASAEGLKVFFTDEQRLTADSKAEAENPDLYVSGLTSGSDGPLAGTLTDLTPGGGVQGVLGASEDGSYVYFVANGVLGDGAERGATQGSCKALASPGATCNLYEYHDGATTFVATLPNEDENDWRGPGGAPPSLAGMTSRVSPNGRYVAFMSERSLTGYDNIDANSRVADEEVFLYDADTGRLVCASCNPTGARPEGMLDRGQDGSEGEGLEIDQPSLWQDRWLAGSVPGGTPDLPGDAVYQSRYLSNSGRLFFNSPDHLVPAATGDKEKVYEYEPGGEGNCDIEPGCVGLISSGTSGHEAAFLDANASGSEVFFLSADRLALQDTDNAVDVYDAHECTSSSPCPPGAGAVPPACTTAESCRTAPVPQPEIFGAPPSQTFSGSGNIAPPAPKLAVKAKPLTRAQKLAKALKACKKKAKKKRAGCERQARRKYGAKAKTKSRAKAKKSVRRGN